MKVRERHEDVQKCTCLGGGKEIGPTLWAQEELSLGNVHKIAELAKRGGGEICGSPPPRSLLALWVSMNVESPRHDHEETCAGRIYWVSDRDQCPCNPEPTI
ncbi:hypothetical protein JOB18_034520 [Solea senegalensis]|uniref:Uncharacterized protein n=1 Tax=Solea senegalensis TaxID=28829 RepID=A0AAV6RE59_SOLSE|nr:hypothetical protein JOB18_034520 [Solea senegalensis]